MTMLPCSFVPRSWLFVIYFQISCSNIKVTGHKTRLYAFSLPLRKPENEIKKKIYSRTGNIAMAGRHSEEQSYWGSLVRASQGTNK